MSRRCPGVFLDPPEAHLVRLALAVAASDSTWNLSPDQQEAMALLAARMKERINHD